MSAADPAAGDRFLHVLSTDDDPAQARLVEQGGARIVDGGEWQVRLGDDRVNSVVIAGQTFSLSRELNLSRFERPGDLGQSQQDGKPPTAGRKAEKTEKRGAGAREE